MELFVLGILYFSLIVCVNKLFLIPLLQFVYKLYIVMCRVVLATKMTASSSDDRIY
jgi:hypothetical protein